MGYGSYSAAAEPSDGYKLGSAFFVMTPFRLTEGGGWLARHGTEQCAVVVISKKVVGGGGGDGGVGNLGYS